MGEVVEVLERIAAALERLVDLAEADMDSRAGVKGEWCPTGYEYEAEE